MRRALRWLLLAVALFGLFNPAGAETSPSRPRLAPDSVFIKTGLAERSAAFSLGTGWDQSDWLWSSLPDALTLAFEIEVGHWQTFHLRHEKAKFTQFGVTPMLRYPFSVSPRREWFAEGGVGFHFVAPLYRSGDKRFSTSFNFQDLLGLGLRFGAGCRHEVALYGSHFSNANLKQPNPGENFLQLRYLRHFN